MACRWLTAAMAMVVLVPILSLPRPATAADSASAEANSLNRQAVALYREGRYAEAEPLYKRSLAMREKALGPEHPDVAASLNNLAELYEAEGRYTEAEPLFRRSLAILEKALGPEHPNVATSLNNLAGLYWAQGRYSEAEPLFRRSVAIRERAPGPEHPRLASSLNNLAELYKAEGRYAEAEPLYKRSLAIWEKALGPEHPDVALSLNNLAGLYKAEGRYAQAEPLYKRSLAIAEKTLGPDHPDVAASLNNLAELYRNQGRYAEAEPLYKRSLAIREKALGPEHSDVAASLNNLAELYQSEGRYDEAAPLLKRGLAIKEKALGPENPSVATSLNNLAELYRNQGRYAAAEPLYKRSLAIREKVLGPEHPDIALSLNNLAELYRNQDRYAEAEPLYKRSLAIWEKALGPEHLEAATGLGNLASLYQSQGRYGEAESLFKRSLAIREKALGPEHPDVALSLGYLAALYAAQGRRAEALGFSRRAVSILQKHLGEATAARDNSAEAERRNEREYFAQNIELLYAAGGADAAAESFRVAQMAEVSSAGAAIAAASARLASGGGARAAVIRERQDLVRQWRALDSALLKAVSRPAARRDAAAETALRARLDDTSKRLDALDARIAAEFPGFAELSNPKPLDAQSAQALLAPDEALLVYLTSGKETWLWVLRRDRLALQRIPLGAQDLAHEVSVLRGALDPERNPDFAPFPAKEAYAFYRKIFSPALPLLQGAHTLLVVPDGALESLPFGVLVTKPPAHDPQAPADHRTVAWLARDYVVTVLPTATSLRALRRPVKVANAAKPFLGVGDPVLQGPPGAARGIKLASLFRGAVADVDDVRQLPALPDTAGELRAIAGALGAGKDDLLLGAQASEPVLRRMPLDHYRVIQFATHGLVSGDLPGLAEPALVLTPPQKTSPEDDGLLTASEIATLKLNAEWIVLSACKTAAGDGTPDAGGLSGLARAFFYAGARSLLVSHWPVWSKAAVALTTGTFAELVKNPKIGRAEALRRAEMAMLDPRNPPEFAHPLAWAPFALAGEGGAGR
ncbi:MAG TPA: CHAT domain-containing tetratricopeptide repeat protein [Stellaceae bacterium]|nr:CHAT domain-containing tetratricopeptide repeat protein [Stellaceae bacterium]